MLNIEQKKKIIAERSKIIKDYSTIAIVPLSGTPDRLLQSMRNKTRENTQFITGRKNILSRILKSNKNTESLTDYVKNTCAIVLSNKDPFEIYNEFKRNSIKLAAKPNQIAPSDINIEKGETSLTPGQAVTELKSAGIDVKIERGKVVISKDKILVKKGEKISLKVAKALYTLDILPFIAQLKPLIVYNGGILFTADVLDISREKTVKEISDAFNAALTISIEQNIINIYTIKRYIGEAYKNSIILGIEENIYDTGIVNKLVEIAYIRAKSIEELIKK